MMQPTSTTYGVRNQQNIASTGCSSNTRNPENLTLQLTSGVSGSPPLRPPGRPAHPRPPLQRLLLARRRRLLPRRRRRLRFPRRRPRRCRCQGGGPRDP